MRMLSIALCAAIAGAIMAVAGGYRALVVVEENWETGGGTPYGWIVCVAGVVIFLGSIGALIGRAYL